MKEQDHRLILEQASRASIERIRLDGEKAPERLKILFAYLDQHIFEKGLDVNQMKRACRKRDNSISSFFAEVTGLGPYAYMVARRVETAAALLRDTNLSIRIISQLVGFTKPGLLTQRFKVQHGMTPREFRLDMNRSVSARALSAAAKDYAFSVGDLETIKVEGLWDALREKPLAEQRDIIRHSLALPTPALFHFLRKKSTSEGRDNRRLGVEFSELAIESLRVTEHIIGRDLFDLRLQGWAWVGNSRRLAYDLVGAEEAFSIAERYLQSDEGSLICAEFYQLKTALRRWQRRFSEALELHKRSLPIFLARGDVRQVTEALLERAFIFEQTGEPEVCIPYLQRSLGVLENKDEPYLEFVVWFNLATAYAKAERYHEANQAMPTIRKLSAGAGSQTVSYHLEWLEGCIEEGLGNVDSAEARYLEAKRGFPTVGHTVHSVLVTIDLALLYLKTQRLPDVQTIVVEVVPILEGMRFHGEAAVCLRMLQTAINRAQLDLATLREIRTRLDQIPLDLTSQLSVIG